jgi:hypothetical protein
MSSPIVRSFSGQAGGLKGAVDTPAADPQVFGYVGYPPSIAEHLDSVIGLGSRRWLRAARRQLASMRPLGRTPASVTHPGIAKVPAHRQLLKAGRAEQGRRFFSDAQSEGSKTEKPE